MSFPRLFLSCCLILPAIVNLTQTASADSLLTVVDPLLHYSFDASTISGSTITDLGTGGNDGTIGSGVSTVGGVFGNAASFTAAGFISSGTPLLSQSDPNQPYTIAFWFNQATEADGGGIISQYPGGANRFILDTEPGFNATPDGTISWWHGDNGHQAATTQDVVDGTFHHIAFVRDDSANMSVYVDGVLDTNITRPNTDSNVFTVENLEIGRGSSTIHAWAGLLDELYVFDQALSQGQISNLMTFNATAVPLSPEPSSLMLGGAAMLMAGLVWWRKKRQG